MTIREALQFGKSQLCKTSGTGLLDTEILLCNTLHCTKELLIKEPERELKSSQLRRFQMLISERASGKPIAYMTHEKEFFGRKFYVDERVLIPRPETEEMVEEAIRFLTENQPRGKARGRQPITIIDLGTGSGCIAITVALELPDWQVIGLDISREALTVARKNAKRLNCSNVKFLHSDLLSAIPTIVCHSDRPRGFARGSGGIPSASEEKLVVLANLPYIGTHTNRFISAETDRFEPQLAIYGGPDGLDLYRRTFAQIKEMGLNVAAMFMEIGFSQAEAISKEVKKTFPEHQLQIKNDLRGFPRMAILLDGNPLEKLVRN